MILMESQVRAKLEKRTRNQDMYSVGDVGMHTDDIRDKSADNNLQTISQFLPRMINHN